MELIYNIGIHLTNIILKIIALFNKKIKQGVLGRNQSFKILQKTIKKTDKTLWFHCASLGEYEQGLPVFKALRKHYKNHKIVLTFFSPSGYEIRKNTQIADVVVYLPMDTKTNAKKFINFVNPELTLFVKYDVWPNYLSQLKQKQARAILISAIFRKNQAYFKSYGTVLTKALFTFEHIFTQNISSKILLESINYNAVTVTGDTRFDRVSSQLDTNNTLDYIQHFKDNKLCIVAGSTWPEDDKLLINFINKTNTKDLKFIIAPHNINASHINNLVTRINRETILFSEYNIKELASSQVFIIDTIGILTKIYSYANIAYVGGAMGNTGLHNTLEPAVFGVPIIIGSNHEKFPEAQELIQAGGMFSIFNQKEFDDILNELINQSDKRIQAGQNSASYINKNKGAVNKITAYLNI